ncbi:MAG: bifunctional oligoribonuclease/PAP phosphatase NrnA [Candidatus Hydrogenedentes bacterium]|nr:bifunctional oligoribonuclease/PAP phosphatase NrnA [Candidatus Hydrogenedentota bacterium]
MTIATHEFDYVLEAFREGTRFVVTSHVSPDGDAIGSVLGIAHLLRGMGKRDVTCVLEDPVPRVYTWLDGADAIVTPDRAGGPFDTAVLIDAHAGDRSGRSAAVLNGADTFVVIDHHLVERADGHVKWVDPTYAAAGEMVYDLFMRGGVPLTKAAAECIYTAQTTDTGSFRYSNTTARSHRIASVLMDAGIDIRAITERVIDTMSRGKYGLLQRVLGRIQFGAGGTVAHAAIYANDLAETGALPEDTDGLINYLRNIEGVRVAMIFREAKDGKTKVSFRTQADLNAADICRAFGGGGHAVAAGATLEGTIAEARGKVLAHLRAHAGLDV